MSLSREGAIENAIADIQNAMLCLVDASDCFDEHEALNDTVIKLFDKLEKGER